MDQLTPCIIIIDLVHPSDTAPPRIKQLTHSVARLLGYSEEELIGKPVDLIYAAENDKALWLATMAKVIDGNTGQSFTGELVTKATNKIQVLISLSVLSSQSPDKTDVVLLIQDNKGEDLNAESAFAESEERFRQLAEMAGEWLWEQDPDGYYSYCSAAVTQILGYSPNEVLGKHYTEFLSPQDKANQQQYTTSHQPFYALLFHYRHKDGR
ncbi:MAG: PAS domain-containing protein, partial [Methylobacter sp.]